MNHFDKDLLPCPFCGASAKWGHTPWGYKEQTGDDRSWWVECTECYVQMPCNFRSEAVERWNKRANQRSKSNIAKLKYVYTLWLHPSVRVRVASDEPFAPAIRAQEAIVAHLHKLKLDDLVVTAASCDRVWPHGRDDGPLVSGEEVT